MIVIVWDNDSKTWEERDLAHGVVTELSLQGRILRTPKNHEDLFQQDPTDEEIDYAAIACEKYSC